MKICLLAPANNYHTKKMVYTLRQAGYDTVICTFHNEDLPGIKVYNLLPILKPLGKINYILAVPALKRLITTIKPDVLHAHYVSSYGVVAYLTGFHPYIISVWGTDIYNAPNNPVLRFLIQKALAGADRILSTSKTMAKHTAKFIRREIIVTPFGVDIIKFKPLGKTKSTFVIGTARALLPKYGIKYLVEAFAVFNRQIPNSELHIAGDGPQKDQLVSLAEKYNVIHKTHFLGFIQPENMAAFFASLDIFCMPSIEESESFGVAALEAQACGVPVISSNIGGLHETVIDGETGFLVPPKAPQQIVDKIMLLYNNKKLYNKITCSARKFVETNYCWEKNFEIFINIYASLVN